MSSNDPGDSLKYIGTTIVSFIAFGFLAIYWSMLSHVGSETVLFHRCLWTFCSLVPCLFYKSLYKTIVTAMRQKGHYLLLSAFFMGVNWFTFIYAVNNQYVFEAGLAYFISPLISILLGFFFLKESISRRQGIAVLLAFISLVYLLIAKGVFPKFALVIGLSFSFYGVIGRKIPFSPVVRMLIESFLICVVVGLFFRSPKELFDHFFTFDSSTQIYLFFSGAATIIPMFLFITSVKHSKFSTVGVLSFILPTVLFLLGIFYFHEEIDREKLVSISLIWIGVGLYSYDLIVQKKMTTLE